MIRELKQQQQQRQHEWQKAIGLDKQNNSARDHAFLYISLPSLNDYNAKLPNLMSFWWT